ncbi:MAG: hypothetical protein ACTSW4_02525 [Candidatus Ranarchaeia archaeon]
MSKMMDKTTINCQQRSILSVENEMHTLSGLIRNMLRGQLDSKMILTILERIRMAFELKEIPASLKQDLVEAYVTCDAYLEHFIPEYRIQDRLTQLLSSIKFHSA